MYHNGDRSAVADLALQNLLQDRTHVPSPTTPITRRSRACGHDTYLVRLNTNAARTARSSCWAYSNPPEREEQENQRPAVRTTQCLRGSARKLAAPESLDRRLPFEAAAIGQAGSAMCARLEPLLAASTSGPVGVAQFRSSKL